MGMSVVRRSCAANPRTGRGSSPEVGAGYTVSTIPSRGSHVTRTRGVPPTGSTIRIDLRWAEVRPVRRGEPRREVEQAGPHPRCCLERSSPARWCCRGSAAGPARRPPVPQGSCPPSLAVEQRSRTPAPNRTAAAAPDDRPRPLDRAQRTGSCRSAQVLPDASIRRISDFSLIPNQACVTIASDVASPAVHRRARCWPCAADVGRLRDRQPHDRDWFERDIGSARALP